MKYTRYILFLLVLILATSCSIDEPYRGNNGKIQLVGRVLPFDELNVGTRAAVNPEEQRLYSLDYLIFAKIKTEPTEEWACVFYKNTKLDIIAIDRSLDFAALHENDADLATLGECRIVILANYTGLQEKIAEWAGNEPDLDAFIKDKVLYTGGGDTDYKKAEDFMSISTSVPALVGIPRTGLPRMGDFGRIVDLSEDSTDPITSGEPSEVTLTSLYAKMVFDISVNATQGNVPSGDDKVDGNKFIFSGYTVHNLAQSVDMNGGNESPAGGNGESDDATTVYENEIEGDLTNAITDNPYRTYFVCYLPERFLLAKTPANEYSYPFSPDGADALLNPEDEKLLQRYKPVLAKDNATYVTFSGVFYNHQGHSYDVSYKIYVGNDNYGNFDVVRNRQYNNYISIRGIESSSDQSANDQHVSIDHRVDVKRTLPIIVSFRRETLLDSHFEIRPLRIRLNDKHNGDLPTGAAVRVKITEYDESGAKKDCWIGLERSYGGGNENKNTDDSYTTGGYCDGEGQLGASSAGKRKYFTTDLTTRTLAGAGSENSFSTVGGQTVIVPVTKAGECVWVYVDECDEESEASFNLDDVRTATISVTYGKIEGGQFKELDAPVNYVVSQHLLFKIQSENDLNKDKVFDEKDCYYIEHEEEYLHNFDAEDNFENNKTDFEGMEWGLYNTQLSDTDPALFFLIDKSDGNDWWSSLVNYVMGVIEDVIKQTQKEVGLDPKYDFYIKKHDSSINSEIEPYEYAGWSFCNKIISKIFPNDNKNRLQLDQKPNSAIEYCYNRNKRKSDGTIDTDNITWYLPAIDEMEDIMMAGYSYFDVFQDKFYWSCQPSYVKQYGYADNIHLSGGLGALITQSVEAEFYMDDIGIYIMDEIGNIQTKNVGRARSTKINYNSSNVDSQYENVLSGIKSYDNAFRIYEENVGNWFWPEYEGRLQIIPIGTYRNYSLYDWTTYVPTNESTHMQYDEGNKLRSDKCRVRAVRRMTTTQ